MKPTANVAEEGARAVAQARGHAPTDELEPLTVHARDALRELVRIVPAGPEMDFLTYARACLWRNEPKSAHDFDPDLARQHARDRSLPGGDVVVR